MQPRCFAVVVQTSNQKIERFHQGWIVLQAMFNVEMLVDVAASDIIIHPSHPFVNFLLISVLVLVFFIKVDLSYIDADDEAVVI